jgi:fluoride exporter
MKLWLLVALGGAVGSVARYGVNLVAVRMLGPSFPWATLTVNVAGSFAMGLLAALISARAGGSAELKALILTGILGGFTTFSAFSLDVVTLLERRELAAAAGYAGASMALTILALMAGLALARALWP